MARLVWACDLCWGSLLQQGARLHQGRPATVRQCDCCRGRLRPGQRVMRFLVPGR